jgi:glycosyltransferase 2 family protein
VILAVIATVFVAVFALIRLRGEFRWDAFLATFKTIDPYWVAMACLLILLAYVVRALRWRIMLRPLRPHPQLWGLITATCIGFTSVTLFGRPGELVRPYLISVRERVPFSSQLAAWLLERIYDLLMVLILFGLALTRMPKHHVNLGTGLTWVLETGGFLAAGIGLACVGILVAAGRFSAETRTRLTNALAFLPPKFHRKAAELIEAFTSGVSCTKSPIQVFQLFSWSVVEWLLIASCTLCLFRGLQATRDMGWVEVIVFLGFTSFGSILQIPGIGGGLQVAGVLVLTKVLGLNLETASGISILFWFLGFVLIVPFGLVMMFFEGVKLKSLRHIAEPEPETPASVS